MLMMMGLILAAQDARLGSNLEDKPPVLRLVTSRTGESVQQCVGLALEPIGRPFAERYGNERRVVFASRTKSPVLISIFDGDPTVVEVRKGFALNKKWRNRIRFCAS